MATDDVFELLEPLVSDRGLELVDVERPGRTLRVVVDAPGGVDLDTLGAVTKDVSLALDEHPPQNGGYTLEVTSPGVERPLRTPRHFRRSVGEEVAVKTVTEVDGQRRFQGELVQADDEAVVIRTDGTERRFLLADLRSARTVFEWGPGPKPGAGGKNTGKHGKAAKHGKQKAKAR